MLGGGLHGGVSANDVDGVGPSMATREVEGGGEGPVKDKLNHDVGLYLQKL